MAATVSGGAGPPGSGAEPLRAQLREKRREANALRAALERAKLDAQQLRVRLQAAGVSDPSLVPARVQAGSGASAETQHFELRSLLQWLVDSVDLTQQVIFECGGSEGEVVVGGRRVLLQRMATWPLRAGGAVGLQFSVPLDLQTEIVGLLVAARQRGRLDEAEVSRLADSWETVGAEVVSAARGRPEPAIFLVHRQTSQAIVVAQWPSMEFGRGGASGSFDPAQHFAPLAAAAAPAAVTAPAATAKEPEDAEGASASRPSVATGDRVEVEYEGRWFAGVLQWVEGDIANVKCDVDAAGVITVAPLTSVRPARSAPEDGPKRALARHARARSAG